MPGYAVWEIHPVMDTEYDEGLRQRLRPLIRHLWVTKSSHTFDQKLLGFFSQPPLAKWRRRAGLDELINRVETNDDRVSAFHSLQ